MKPKAGEILVFAFLMLVGALPMAMWAAPALIERWPLLRVAASLDLPSLSSLVFHHESYFMKVRFELLDEAERTLVKFQPRELVHWSDPWATKIFLFHSMHGVFAPDTWRAWPTLAWRRFPCRFAPERTEGAKNLNLKIDWEFSRPDGGKGSLVVQCR